MNFVWNLETLLRRRRLPLPAELKSDYTVPFTDGPEFEDSGAATAWSHILAKKKLISRWHEVATSRDLPTKSCCGDLLQFYDDRIPNV